MTFRLHQIDGDFVTVEKNTLSGRGSVYIGSGTITEPLAYLDIALPAGFLTFELQLVGWDFSALDTLAGALSQDGGMTWLNDTTNYDTYGFSGVAWMSQNSVGVVTTQYMQSSDAVMKFSFYPSNRISLQIWPGDGAQLPALVGRLPCVDNSGIKAIIFYEVMHSLNQQATVPPTFARANMLRLLPYGNEDVNPPTSGETITAGTWVLTGMKP